MNYAEMALVILGGLAWVGMLAINSGVGGGVLDRKMEQARHERGWTPEMVEVILGPPHDPVATYLWNHLGVFMSRCKPYADAVQEYESAWYEKRIPLPWSQIVVQRHRDAYAKAAKRGKPHPPRRVHAEVVRPQRLQLPN